MAHMEDLHQEKALWLSCDPVTLVTAARDALYQQVDGEDTPAAGPIEEVISRFEQQTRAAIGRASFTSPDESRQTSGRKSGYQSS